MHSAKSFPDIALGDRVECTDIFELGAVPGFGNGLADSVKIGVEIGYKALAQIVDLVVGKHTDTPFFEHCIMEVTLCQFRVCHMLDTECHMKMSDKTRKCTLFTKRLCSFWHKKSAQKTGEPLRFS